MQHLQSTQRTNVLGVGISAVNLPRALSTIEGWLSANQPQYVCVTPVHSVMLCHQASDLRHIFNQAGMVTPDGMPLVWLSRLSGHAEVDRVYGPDLMLAVCERFLAYGTRHYFYGSTQPVLDQLVANLTRRFPDLVIAGSYSPPYRPLSDAEERAIIDTINQSQADIVWVGLGAPKQERWMAKHRQELAAPVLIGVGAAFDFHAGLKPQAPRWMQRNGLEWLFRLASEPRRLWKRYLINNPLFVAHILLQMTGMRQYKI